jgi:hypothetical protein
MLHHSLQPEISKVVKRAVTHTYPVIQNLIHEPTETELLEELDDIKYTMGQDTPLSWLIETLTGELWNEEQFQGGDLPIQCMSGLQTV